jgi:pantetheine-phosphate adenylyltransferase
MRTAFYSGSFDPVTNGHVDILRQAAHLCDRLVLGIGVHPSKGGLFTPAEREALITKVCTDDRQLSGLMIHAVTFSDLAVVAAKRHGATMIVRGLRDGSDLDYEMQMAGMNQVLAPDLCTVFLPARPSVRYITATLVRQIASLGGDVAEFVPDAVYSALREKFPPTL